MYDMTIFGGVQKFLTSGQTKNQPFLKLQIPEARPTNGSCHPSFFVSLYTYLEGSKQISSSQANFYEIIYQGLDYLALGNPVNFFAYPYIFVAKFFDRKYRLFWFPA